MGDKKLCKREEITAEYKWKLEDMFESDQKWESEAALVADMADEIAQYQDRLGDSAAILLEFFNRVDELEFHLERVYVYANQRHHEDTTVALYQGYSDRKSVV